MNEGFFAELSAWLTEAGLASTPETAIVSGFCDRCVAAGLPLARSLLFIDTLHPVHERRLFRWGYRPGEVRVHLKTSGVNPSDWRSRSGRSLRGRRARRIRHPRS